MNDLIDLADKHNDHLTHGFITQFVPQQIADTAEADDVLTLFSLRWLALFLLIRNSAKSRRALGTASPIRT